MLKKYISNSDISINVKNGNSNMHLSFIPIMGGGSIFTTDNEKIQKSIESHYRFGELFTIANDVELQNANECNSILTTEVENPLLKNNGEKTILELNKIEVTSIEDAVEYLADKGISRTKLKNIKSIKDNASKAGVEFIGI